ncbi:NADPH-dependent 2,4-dienoyl-CoA reductase/sulfur reductase-like enzyme [Streptohalobacillus salinus]|uniref:NADPH-dependent 2,4-dienoyl-CoA reductase/sulfur reductase-like enzyme n=1 Tax=Streptohalobacillus salinus TaxID=621096 RepID=A0A2V3WFV0_9BACI|nr:FAD-dependent oxidoreductase [Streptohalobacillus salinus]PXW92120.1 NADPH-dependent 2,4-dienoyl-CoA reductase/sulfur reductase-like enzyme [Streptohalobacillus salinus]
MKVAVIGCTHAGTAAIKNTLALYPEAEIHVFERNDTVSFLSCGIALYVGGVVEEAESLFYASVEGFEDKGVNMYMKHEVTDVDVEGKQLEAKDLTNDKVTTHAFDKLIVTTGSWPITPPFPGFDLDNIVLCKNYDHAKEIIRRSEHVENVTVVGGGYIGVELVEAFEEKGKNVTLIDAESRILSRYLDKTFTDPVEATLREKGVDMHLDELVKSFEGKDSVEKVITNKGEIKADLVVLCIGFRPNTDLFKDKLQTLPNGAIVIDEYMQTSEKDIYAAGDCCAVPYNPTKKQAYIPLATNAVRMGTLVAQNLVKPTFKHPGTQGTSGLKIYNHYIGSTGLTENAAAVNEMEVGTAYLEDTYRPDFMPENSIVKLKLVYEKATHRVVGAQVISDTDLTQVVNTVSVAIAKDVTIEELALTDFFFQPHFNKPVNYLNQVALMAMEDAKE